jgi:hypothetical protein
VLIVKGGSVDEINIQKISSPQLLICVKTKPNNHQTFTAMTTSLIPQRELTAWDCKMRVKEDNLFTLPSA